LDQVLVLEPLQRLADGSWADTESLGELALGEALAGCELSADDPLTQSLVGLVRERRAGRKGVLSLRSDGGSLNVE
jgi:hypothetical protein